MSVLKQSIIQAGGVAKASSICGVSQRAVYKWIAAEALPRTEYSGETCYARLLAAASRGQFTAEWLLLEAMPRQALKLAS